MAQKNALERWETKIANCEVTPQGIWPIAKFLTKGGGPKAPSVIYDLTGPIFYPTGKAKIIADCLEKQFIPHELCDSYHKIQVEAGDSALLATVGEDIPVKFQPCDVSKEIQSLKLGKASCFDGIPNEYLRHIPRRPLAHLTLLFNHCLRFSHFLAPWKEAKIRTLLKPGKDQNFPQN
jgi:hypothetical protein